MERTVDVIDKINGKDFDFTEATEMLNELNESVNNSIDSITLMKAFEEIIAEMNRHWYTRLWWRVCRWWSSIRTACQFFVVWWQG